MTDPDAVADAPFLDLEGETDALQRSMRLSNAVDDGIYQLDAAGRIVAANDVFVETTGYARDDLLGEHVSVLVHDADVEFDRFETQIAARTTTVTDTPIEIVVAHSGDGAHLADERPKIEHQEDDQTDFLDEERELIDTLATLLQFHFDRREYIDELQASNERLEQFAYAASHDLQEPLRMVSSYVQLIERRYSDALDAVLADVRGDLQLSIDERDAAITSESLPTVHADPSQLRQVFQNLLDNAIRYSGDDPPRVHVAAEASGDEWVIAVSDEGIGIDADDANRVFEVFQRLHTHEEHPGTGIGLALCRRIVERHEGELWVESEPGAGTTFSFSLPAVEDRDETVP